MSDNYDQRIGIALARLRQTIAGRLADRHDWPALAIAELLEMPLLTIRKMLAAPRGEPYWVGPAARARRGLRKASLAKARRLHDRGMTATEIAKTLGVTPGTVRRYVAEAEGAGR